MMGRSKLLGILIIGIAWGFQEARSYSEDSAFTSSNDCGGFVSRESWGARAPINETKFSRTPEFVVIAHTVTPSCYTKSECIMKIRSMQNYHMDTRFWADIAYNFLIGENGDIYVGRGWENVGSHTQGYNNRSIAIAFIGNFNDQSPNSIALDAAKKLMRCGVDGGKISENYKLVGHRQIRNTISPGNKLFDIIEQWPHWTTSV